MYIHWNVYKNHLDFQKTALLKMVGFKVLFELNV